MADASFVQSSFLGGQFSPAAQGRSDLPEYRTSLAQSVNGLPVEEGSWTRRSGTWVQGHTINSANGKIITFWLPNNVAAILELTPGFLQYWLPATIVGNVGYAPYSNVETTWDTVAQVQSVRMIQADNIAFFFCPGQEPVALTVTNYAAVGPGVPPVFVFTNPHFEQADGPYNDPLLGSSQTGNSTGSVSDGTSNPTFTITDSAYAFIATDLNRAIRLWSQPPAWSSTTNYPEGAFVSYAGTYWRCLVGGSAALPYNLGIVPGANTQPPAGSTTVPTQAWGLAPQAGVWIYGFISSLPSNTAQCGVTIRSPLPVPVNQNGFVIDTWQLGTYTAAIWPTCGTYHEGRLILAGAVANRFDMCVANGIGQPTGILAPLFSPTDLNGNVLDDSGITYTVNSTGSNQFLWMIPDHMGILAGTAGGEWLIEASALNDPLTPTSIQAHRTTTYKSQNSEPVRMGIGIGFIQSFGRRLMEYVVDVFSQKFIGRHLNQYAKDLTTKGISNIAYQEELAPVIWGVTNDGTLIGCTYRRVSNFGQEAPIFNGWHVHPLGSGRKVQWICMGTSAAGTEDVLALLTQDSSGVCRLETMLPIFDVNSALWQAWYLDGAYPGPSLTASLLDNSIWIGGLAEHNGESLGVFLAELYCGTYLVENGLIQVPFGSDPDGLLDLAYLANWSGNGYGFYALPISDGALTAKSKTYTVSCVVGYPMTSTWQLNRPEVIEDVRTSTGPGLGKTRRLHMYAIKFVNTVTGAQIGVDDGPTNPIKFVRQDQQTPLLHNQMLTGVHWDTIDGDYNLNGQLTCTQSLPYPMTVAAVSGFIRTQDR